MPLVSFEGPDGAGKTTHINLLIRRLKQCGVDPVVTREPGGTVLGNQLREMVLGQNCKMAATTEMLLIAAARAQHVDEIIRPGLSKGKLVITDRFIDSSLVYQGYALDIGLDRVQQVNETAIDGVWPDLTLLLSLSAEKAYERSVHGRATADRIESRGLDYYRKVCLGYELVAQRFPQRVVVIDADRSVAAVHEDIWQRVDQFLDR